jgi:hypothetical protein
MLDNHTPINQSTRTTIANILSMLNSYANGGFLDQTGLLERLNNAIDHTFARIFPNTEICAAIVQMGVVMWELCHSDAVIAPMDRDRTRQFFPTFIEVLKL